MSLRRENINCEDPTDIGPAKDRTEARIWARYAAEMGSGGESKLNAVLHRKSTKEYWDAVNSGAFVRRNVLLDEMNRKWQEDGDDILGDEMEEAEHEWDEHVDDEHVFEVSKKTVRFSRRQLVEEREIYMWAAKKMVKGRRGFAIRTVKWEGARGRTAEQAVELEYAEKRAEAADVVKAKNLGRVNVLTSVLSYATADTVFNHMEFSGLL
jgi:hypothetical protein